MLDQRRVWVAGRGLGRLIAVSLLVLLFATTLGLTVTTQAPARSEPPPVVLDQSPIDCFSRCAENWSKPVISIQKAGIFVGRRRVTEGAMLSVLDLEYRKVSGARVFIRADAEISYGEFLRICRLVEAGGYAGQIRVLNEDIE